MKKKTNISESKTVKSLTKKNHIPNLKKAFDTLEQISSTREGLTFPMLLEKISCNKTSLFRILETLEDIGYIRKNAETDSYTITKKILPLAYSTLCDANLIEESTPILRNLRDATTETTMLGAFVNNECIMINQESGLHPFNFTGKLGMPSPLYASAPGKALLAALPEDNRNIIIKELSLEKCATHTITNEKTLKKVLKIYEKQGFATDESEALDGVNCIASAICDSHQNPIAAIWITGPSSRIKKDKFIDFGEKVKSAALEISQKLRYPNF